MSDTELLKQQIMAMAAEDLVAFLHIVEDIGYTGVRILRYKKQGFSLQQCATKHGVSKRVVRRILAKCDQKGHASALIKLNLIK
jgi:hypothetical protein